MLLRSEDNAILMELFDAVDLPLEVWAYGSRVNGTAHSGSDLDLVLHSEDLQPLPLGAINFIKEKIMHSNIPILVQVQDWARIPESFHAQIALRHEVLYSNLTATFHEPPRTYKKKREKDE